VRGFFLASITATVRSTGESEAEPRMPATNSRSFSEVSKNCSAFSATARTLMRARAAGLRRVVLGLGLEGLGSGAAVVSSGVTASAGASYGKGSDMGSPQGTDVLRTPKAGGGGVRRGGDGGYATERGPLH